MMDTPLSPRHAKETVPKFLTGANVTPITMRTPLHHDAAEPEADTTVTRAPAIGWGVGAGNPPAGDDELSLDDIFTPTEEGGSGNLPKPRRGKFCELCPGLSSFATKGALRKHKREAHVSSLPKCPICPARVSKQPLARHLKRAHGITDAVAETISPEMPTPTYVGGAVEPLHGSHDTNAIIISNADETKSGSVYCQEYDCGRGFSSKTCLESHMRYSHSKQPKQIADGQEVSSSSKVVAERPTVPLPIETHYPSASANVDGRSDNRGFRPAAVESSPSIEGGVGPRLKTTPTASEILPLRCGMCDTPPTLKTRPTVTTCGHLFCFGCITQHVSSTSKCPVCNSPLLLYCLFELDPRPRDVPVSIAI